MRILLVEDDADLADAVFRRLTRAGHAVDLQADGADASSVLSYQKYDLVILDVGVPQRDGFELLAELRRRNNTTRVLMLTARGEIEDRVRGLNAGANDYLPKPFDFREFDARCDALLRLHSGPVPSVTTIETFDLDRHRRCAVLKGTPLALTKREYGLLRILIDDFARVVSKEEIIRQLNNFDSESGDNFLHKLVGRLRVKLEGAPFVIRTVHGVGYCAESPAPANTDD